MKMQCQTRDCDRPPAYRFTWPGRDESACCAICALQIQGVAGAIGLYLQMIPLTVDDYLKQAEEPHAT